MTAIEANVAESVDLSATDRVYQSGFFSMVEQFSRVGELLPAWWSVARDKKLRLMWKDDGYLSGFMNLGRSKLSSIPIRVEPKNPNIGAHVMQAEAMTEILNSASEFGEGLAAAMDKGAEDYLGQDNGMFLEAVARGAKDTPISGPVLSIIHRDSQRCTRTGDPIFPVVYNNRKGERLVYHWTRIIMMSENRSSSLERNSVGYCAVSRSVKLAHGMMSALNYRLEQMGARPVNRLLVGDGIEGAEILQAIVAATSIMEELGLMNLSKTVAIGGKDISIEKVDLNNFDQFDEEAIVSLGLHSLAFIWGVEPNEVLQIMGSKSSDQVALQRARSKLPQRFIANLEPQMWKIVPPHLELVLDYQDDHHDHQRAVIDDIEARNISRKLESGVTTASVERRKLYDMDRISRPEFRNMQLGEHLMEDDTPVAKLFFNDRYRSVLLVPRNLLVPTANDPVEAITLLEANEVAVYAIMGQSSSEAVTRLSMEALSALDWLKGKYSIPAPQGGINGEEEAQEAEEQEDEEEGAGDGEDQEQANGQGGRVSEKSFFQNSKTWRALRTI